MVNVHLDLSIFTVFLKNKNIIFKIRRSKVTDYAALIDDFLNWNIWTIYHSIFLVFINYLPMEC